MANFAGFLRKAFPFIHMAASFGGPLGEGVANLIGTVLKLDPSPDSTPDAIGQVVAGATQDQINALKQIEADLKVKMASLNIQSADDLLGLDDSDRANARARQIALRDKLPPILAIFITLGFFGVLYLFATHSIAAQARDVMDEMIGTLGTAWVAVVTYYFGSSAGSARKTEIMSNGAAK